MAIPSVVVRCELKSVDPCVWRIVRVPAGLPLSELHRVLQMVMGWHDRHPHAFEMESSAGGGVRCMADETQTVTTALGRAGRDLLYIYKADVAWQVRIRRAPGTWKRAKDAINCLDGYLTAPSDEDRAPAAYTALLADFDRGAVNRALAAIR